MTKRQTKFGRPDVNDAPQMSRFVLSAMAIGSPTAQITGGEAAAPGTHALKTTRGTLCSG